MPDIKDPHGMERHMTDFQSLFKNQLGTSRFVH